MASYGRIEANGDLSLSSKKLDGYKLVEYADIPDFDQSAEYVSQVKPVDQGDHIFVGVEIHELENVDDPYEDDLLN